MLVWISANSMATLSKPWDQRQPRYDVLVIGSGYGGSITAARIAQSGLASVCILERGKEWTVGTFPDTDAGYVSESRINRLDLQIARLDNPLGVYETVVYRDISIIKGNGLGGTSLVNANVALRADPELFTLGWPAGITRPVLDPYYDVAEGVLAVAPAPGATSLPKVEALHRRAQQIGLSAQALPIAVNFTSFPGGINPHGVPQPPCIQCGDCYTGCNVGSKNTLYMNYLPMAHQAGADIFTQIEIEWIEPVPGSGWRAHGVRWIDQTTTEPVELEATQIILSAGAVNTPEILIRSRDEHGLSVSPALGTRFSANGDFFGLSYNGDTQTRVLGFGNHPSSPLASPPTGPAIAGGVFYNAGGPVDERFLIIDVSFASAFVRRAQRAFAGVTLLSIDTDAGDTLSETWRVVRGLINPLDKGSALNHTMLYLCIGIDDSGGRFVRQANGRIEIEWPNVGQQPVFARINAEIFEHAKSEGAHFVENPVWAFSGRQTAATAHPLGGCPLSDDHNTGVTDQFGRVYAADGSIHQGLLIADGSLVPSALAVNPFLTISALSERIAEYKVRELNGIPYP
jgi:cholesterol oxidase